MESCFVAYYRVSTDRQGQSGLGLQGQKSSVEAFCAAKGPILREYIEVESGKRSDRPQLALAVKEARKLGATLIIAKLDRLSRNVHFISGLLETGVNFISADMPQADKFMLHVYAALSEQEARQISVRTKLALQAAKARGVKLGANGRALAERNKREASRFSASIISTINEIRESGVTSLNGIAKELTARGVKTFRNNSKWQAIQVKNVMSRPAESPLSA